MKVKKMGKRVLSIVLCLTMLLTTFCIFDIGSLMSNAAATSGDVLFYVPETVYLKPSMTSFKETTTATFQYFVQNNVVDGQNLKSEPEVIAGNVDRVSGNTVGYVYFQCSTATSATLSYSFEGASGQVAYSSSFSKTGNYYKATINRDSSKATLGASATGCYIKWTVTYQDSADGETKQASTYTYVYKPNVTPYGSGSKARNNDGISSAYYCETDSLSWVTGVHSIASNDANYYARFRTESNGATLAAFLSDENVEGNSGNIGRWTNDNHVPTYLSSYRDMYRIYASSDTSKSYFKDDASNNWFGDWLTTDTTDAYSIPTFNGVEVADGNKYITAAASSKAVGTLYIDTSRYSNLNQIPNLGAGFFLTQTWNFGSNSAAWYVADVTNLADDINGVNWKTTNDYWRQDENTRAHGLWYNPGSILATDASSLTVTTLEVDGKGDSSSSGLRYAGNWTSTIDTSASTKDYYFRGIGTGEQKNGSEYTTASATVKLHAVQINKSALRTAVNESLKKFAYYGIYNDNGTYKAYSSKVANDKVPAFVAALEEAQKGLVTLDKNCDTKTLISELENAEAQLTAITYASAAFVAPEAIYLTPANSTAGQNFQYYINNNVTIDTTAQTASISTSADKGTQGYIYFYYPDAKDGTVTISHDYDGSMTISSLSKGTDGCYKATITGGASASYTSKYITWTVKYTDEADGLEKAVFAKTYVYAPYIYTAAASANAYQEKFYLAKYYKIRIGVTSMIYGVHSMKSTGSAIYVGTNSMSSGNDGTGTFNKYPILTSSYAADLFCNGSAPSFHSAGGEGFAYWYANTSESSVNLPGGIAQLYVDSSRYDYLGQIPNFTLRADFNGQWDNNGDGRSRGYSANYYTIAEGKGASESNTVETTSANYFEGEEGNEVTHTGTADLSGVSVKIGSIINHTWGKANPNNTSDTTNANVYAACDIVRTDKTGLREEIIASTAAMPSFAIKADSSSHFGYNSTKLTRFINAYKAAYEGLTKVDGGNNAEALRQELYDARMDLPNATFTMDFNAGSDTVYYKHGDNDFGGQTSPVETYATVIGSVFGTKAAFPSPHRIGYNFLGWYTRNDGTLEEVKAANAITKLMPADVNQLKRVDAYTAGYQDGVTLYARWEKADEQLLLDNVFNFDTFAATWLVNSAATSTAQKADLYYYSNVGSATVDYLNRSISLTATGSDCYTHTMSYSAAAGSSYAIPGLEKGQTYALIFDYEASAAVTLAPYVNIATTQANYNNANVGVSAGTGTMALSFTVPADYNGNATLRLGFINGAGATVTFSNISISKRYQTYDEYADDAIDSTTVKEYNKPFDVYWLIDDTNSADNYAISTSDNARIVDTREMNTVTAAKTLTAPKCNNPLLNFVSWDDANVAPTGDYKNPDSANSTWILKADYSELSAQLNIAQVLVDINGIYENSTHGDHHDYFTADSYAAFKAAFDTATEAKNYNGGDLNADRQPYLDKVAQELETAIANLTPNQACYDEFNEILSTANAKLNENNDFAALHDSTDKFTATTLAALKSAINEANALDKNLTFVKGVEGVGIDSNDKEYIIIQKQIDDITAKLTAAVNGLQYADAYTQKLKDTVDSAKTDIVKPHDDMHAVQHDVVGDFNYTQYVPDDYYYWKDTTNYDNVVAKIAEIEAYLATNHKTNEQPTIDNYIIELNNLSNTVKSAGNNAAYLARVNAAVAAAEAAIAKQEDYQSNYDTTNYYWSNAEYDSMVSQYNATLSYLASAHTTAEQTTMNEYTKALENCVAALTLNRADYTSIDNEIANAQPYIDLWNSYEAGQHGAHHDYYVAADYNALTDLIADIKTNKYQYTTDKQDDVLSLANAIKTAYSKLSPVEACYDELTAKIAQANQMIVDPAETEFYASLAYATEINATKGTAGAYTTLAESQKVVDDATIRLNTAINSLQKRDVTEMRNAYNYAMSLIEEHYTRASWAALDAEIKNINTLLVMDDNNQFYASEQRIHDEAQKIYTAVANLKFEYIEDDDTDDDKYDDIRPEIIGGDGVTITYQTQKNIPYRICTVSAPMKNAEGQDFSWWVDANGSVVSSYRSYSFYACAAVTLIPVYGQSQEDIESHYAAMRVVGVRQNNNITHTGVYSILVERSMSRYLDPGMTQHGVIYSKNQSDVVNAASANYPTAGTSPSDLGDDVYAPCASKTATSRNGLFEVQVKLNVGDTIYIRPYVMIGGQYYYFDVMTYTATSSITTSSEDTDFIMAAMNIDEYSVDQIVVDDDSNVPVADDPTVDVPDNNEDVTVSNGTWFDMLIAWFKQIINLILSSVIELF